MSKPGIYRDWSTPLLLILSLGVAYLFIFHVAGCL